MNKLLMVLLTELFTEQQWADSGAYISELWPMFFLVFDMNQRFFMLLNDL